MSRVIRIAAVVCTALFLAGCVVPRDFDDGTSIRARLASAEDLAKPKTVYFATTRCKDDQGAGAPGSKEELFRNRCWEASLKNAEMSRLGFGMAEGGSVVCGSAAVTVVPNNGERDLATTVDVPVAYDCSRGFEELRQVVLNAPCRCALIFVHGYNTTFGFGIKRAAQIALDLRYEGPVIMFSFAAGGRLSDYVNDGEAADLAVPVLKGLLHTLCCTGGAANIDVVAHSMGARLAMSAISEEGAPGLRYVVLAAPDIDQAAFLRLTPKVAARTKRLTLYTAKYDVGMSASRATHAGYARVGEGLSGSAARDLTGVEIIDATLRATDPYAHSYFAESEVVIEDIRGVFAHKAARERPPLVCEGDAETVTTCTIPCPAGKSCTPSLYARFMRWLLD